MALDVDATRFTGRAFRHAYPGADPLAPRDPAPDNRWQRGETLDAVHLADQQATAWAEWYRHLAEAGIPPNQQMPRDLWTWAVDAVLADLSTPERLARLGLEQPRPGRRFWPAFQAAGEALAAEGWAGLIAPSAARPDGRVVCLFRAAEGTVTGAQPVPPPERVWEPLAPSTGLTT